MLPLEEIARTAVASRVPKRGEPGVSLFEPASTVLRAGVRPEVQLLLAWARTTIDADTAERIKALLQEEIDWSYVFRKAEQNFVMPLLCWNVLRTCRELVPKSVLDQLTNYLNLHARHNLCQTKELIKILRLFDAQRIRALAFKGPVLAALAYGNLSLRQFGDLDILVRKRDARRAVNLLISQGYKPECLLNWPQAALTPANREKDLGLVRDDGKVGIDLHWQLFERHTPLLDIKRKWENLGTVPLAGSQVLTLPLNDLLLYLCMHGSKHRWQRLAWISDIAELIRSHPGIDWELVMEQSGMLGCKRALNLGLLLASDLLGAAIPGQILQDAQADRVAKSLAAHADEWLFSEPNDSLGLFNWYRYQIRMKERWRDKIRLYFDYFRFHLGIIKPNAKDHTFLPLPASLSFLSYLLRPLRLITQYGVARSKAKIK